jgi:NADPH:quinone reductase-like Zn-dependent oxidoreductase
MEAIVATPEGASWTERRDVPGPEPNANEAVVAVRAFGINRGELHLLTIRGDGWQPGQDVAGEVIEAAADGSGPRVGARVAGLATWHGWAREVAVPTHRLALVPDGVEDAQAAALPMAGSTAANLVRLGGSLLGRGVLVTGASGGVGHFAVQLAAGAGAHVTAVAGARHAERLRALGAREVVADVADAPEGQHLVLESVGGASLGAALEKAAHQGLVVLFGNSSRERTEVEFSSFAGREVRVQTYFSYRHEHEAGDNLRLLLDLLSAGRLEVDIGFEESWSRVNDALDGLKERRFAGKAVLLVD